MRETTCTCGRATRDEAFMCDDCGDELARLLGDVPAIVEDLDITITGQRGKAPASGRSATTALPWNDKAAVVLQALRNELVNAVRTCIEDQVRNSSPYPGWPDDTLPAISAWLLWRVDGLAFHEEGPGLMRRLASIEGRAIRAVDRRPDVQYLGSCIAPSCDGGIYAEVGDLVGHCRRPECRAPYKVDASRRTLEAALDARLCTAAEIAHLATYLGLRAKREAVRKRVNQWHTRGLVTPKSHAENGDPRFAYGEVRGLLYREFSEVGDTA